MDERRYRESERRLWVSVGVSPTEQRLHLGRNHAAVRVQEVGEGPAVVFVHGASNSGTSWASLVARLDGLRCVLLDRPGCGLSPPLGARLDVEGGRMLAESLIVDVLDALALESAHVVATSFGGYTALRTAAAHPDRIDRMVHFGWPVGAPVARLPAFMRVGNVPGLGRLMTAIPPNERAVRLLLGRIGLGHALETGGFSPEALDCYVSLLRDTDTMRNEYRGGRFISPLRGLDDRLVLSEEELAAIKSPISFLWGEDDPFGGAEIARQVTARIPNAELEMMPGAGHAVWMDDADHAATHIKDFFGR